MSTGDLMPAEQRAALSRRNDGWLAEPERRAITWAAPRLPRWISPDQLTALGFVGALMAFGSYLLAAGHPAWLWMVNAGLVINWFGDSLDGAVARLRGVERPHYGFFLDQSTDVVSQVLFALGIGLSGFVSFGTAALGLAAYLMMTVQSLLRAEVTRTFHLASGGMGLTEVRCLFLLANALFYFVPPTALQAGPVSILYGDVLGVIWIGANVGLYLVNMARELGALGAQEPMRPPKEPPSP
jgi:phosphatidylglycerophosphate synthase